MSIASLARYLYLYAAALSACTLRLSALSGRRAGHLASTSEGLVEVCYLECWCGVFRCRALVLGPTPSRSALLCEAGWLP